jgi:hypothetical protein
MLFRLEGLPTNRANRLAAQNLAAAFERECGFAEGAFGHQTPDIPMSTSATWAVIGFLLAVHHMVTALMGFWDDASAPCFQDVRGHDGSLQILNLRNITQRKSEGFHEIAWAFGQNGQSVTIYRLG